MGRAASSIFPAARTICEPCRPSKLWAFEIRSEANCFWIEGAGWDGLSEPVETLDCGNSGTAMRLLSGVVAGRLFASRLDGDASLRQRPMQRVIDPLTVMGAKIDSREGKGLAPLEIHGGRLRGIDYRTTGCQRPGEIGDSSGGTAGRGSYNSRGAATFTRSHGAHDQGIWR